MAMKFMLPPEVVAHARQSAQLRDPHKIVGLRFSLTDDKAPEVGAAIAAALLGRPALAGVAARAEGNAAQPTVPGQRDYVLFLHLDFDRGVGEVVYNGPEAPVADLLELADEGPIETSSIKLLRALDAKVADNRRLKLGEDL